MPIFSFILLIIPTLHAEFSLPALNDELSEQWGKKCILKSKKLKNKLQKRNDGAVGAESVPLFSRKTKDLCSSLTGSVRINRKAVRCSKSSNLLPSVFRLPNQRSVHSSPGHFHFPLVQHGSAFQMILNGSQKPIKL